VRAAIGSGMTPTRAVQIAAFAIIEGSLGREATRTLGVPRPTLSRWRRELADASGATVARLEDPQLEVDLVNELLPALGFRDLRMHREVVEDDQPASP